MQNLACGRITLSWPIAFTATRRSGRPCGRKSTEDGTQPLNAAEAYYLGTTAGHRYFGAGKGFAIGDRLHAVVVDDSRLCSVGEMSLSDRLERALYRVSRQEIKAVYAEGKLVKCS